METPMFGAVWFTARLETDRAERTAAITEVDVTRTRFAEQDEEKAAQLALAKFSFRKGLLLSTSPNPKS